MTSSSRLLSRPVVPGRPALRKGRISLVWRPWVLFSTIAMICAAVLIFAASIAIGDYPLTVPEVLRIIFLGDGSRIERIAVFDWRMPRALTALTVGFALGLAGALTQSVTGNPLASPDILGITSGASAAAVTVLTFGGGIGAFAAVAGKIATFGLPLAALAGGLITGAVVWILSSRGSFDAYRLVLFGIIITALMNAYIGFLMTRAELRDAATAQQWLAGSLNSTNWDRAVPVALVILICVPLLAWMAYTLTAAVLGQDLAAALGLRVSRTQLTFLVIAVTLASIAVAAAGPIGFVAFVAPQLAVRITRLSTPPLVASAFMGAILLLGADLVVRTNIPVDLPVGIVTSAFGGVFLLYLLISSNLKRSRSS